MVQIKTKLSKGSGPMHSVKIGHHLDPCHTRIFRIFFDLSLNAPSHFCQKSPFIIASSLSVTPRLISCFWMSLGGFIKTCVFFSNVYPIITFFWGGGGRGRVLDSRSIYRSVYSTFSLKETQTWLVQNLNLLLLFHSLHLCSGEELHYHSYSKLKSIFFHFLPSTTPNIWLLTKSHRLHQYITSSCLQYTSLVQAPANSF